MAMYKSKKCEFCGELFELTYGRHYLARDDRQGLSFGETALYDTFDCPHCGCQYRAQIRKRKTDEGGNNND